METKHYYDSIVAIYQSNLKLVASQLVGIRLLLTLTLSNHFPGLILSVCAKYDRL